MPLYEYQCQQCQRLVEKIQKFSDAPLTLCPHCGGALERTLTAAAVQFKGSGWYKDLYSSAKPPAANVPSIEGAAAPAGGGEAANSAPATADKPANTPAPAASSAPAPAASSSSAPGS